MMLSEKIEILGKGITYNLEEEGDYWLIKLSHENGDECYFVLKEISVIHSLSEKAKKEGEE